MLVSFYFIQMINNNIFFTHKIAQLINQNIIIRCCFKKLNEFDMNNPNEIFIFHDLWIFFSNNNKYRQIRQYNLVQTFVTMNQNRNDATSHHLFNHILKQFKSALSQLQINELLNPKQILDVLVFMGYADEQKHDKDVQLSHTIAWLLSINRQMNVSRNNLFKFLLILHNIPTKYDQSFYVDEVQGIPCDTTTFFKEPLIKLRIGTIDQKGVWSCTEEEKKQIRLLFSSMNMKRISKSQFEGRRKSQSIQNQANFQPKILPKSTKIAENRNKKMFNSVKKVQQRLILSQSFHQEKVEKSLKQIKQKELEECSFKPMINLNTKQNSCLFADENQKGPTKLILKGQQYQRKREKLKAQQDIINQSKQLQQCTFKPNILDKPKITEKWICVRNRDKQIQRLKEGRKQRQLVNQLKQRGYPKGVCWQQHLKLSKSKKTSDEPILCIDLKLMNEQRNIDVYQGQNLITLAQKISLQHKIPQQSWWKVQDLIRNAIESCPQVAIESNRILIKK